MRSSLGRERAILIGKTVCLAALCGLAFAYCAYNIVTIARYSESYSPDEGNYLAMARRLLQEHTYSFWGLGPDAYVSPGYPLFLAGCMAVFGTDAQGVDCIKFVQAGLVALTVLLVFLQGYLLTKKYSVGIVAAALLACNGSYPFYSRRLLTEVLFVFTMMLFFVVLTLALQREKWWLHLLAGALLCVAVFVRPLLVVVLPVAYLPLLVKYWRQWRKFFLPFGLFLLGFVLVGLPWWVRNLVTLHKFIFLATQTNPLFAGLAEDPAALGLEDPGSFTGNIALFFQLLFTRPVETIRWMLVQKFDINFMRSVTEIQYLPTITTFVKNVTLFLGLLGALRALFSHKLVWPALTFFLYFLSIFAFVPSSRYALQYLPLLAVFAGYGAAALFTGTGRAGNPFRREKRAAPARPE